MARRKNKGSVEVIKDDDSKTITVKNQRMTKSKFLEVPHAVLEKMTDDEIQEKYKSLIKKGYQIQISII